MIRQPVKQDDGSYLVPLTKHQFAIIDEQDLNVCDRNWGCVINKKPSGDKYYARWQDWQNKKLYMHRMIMGVTDRKIQVDHIDGNSLNNRRNNLRVCTNQENSRNSIGNPRRREHSVFKCVSFDKRCPQNPWVAYYRRDGKKIHIGNYPDEVSAALAYNQVAKEHYLDFAKLNETGDR